MAGIQFRIEMQPDAKVVGWSLGRMADQLEDFSPLFQRLRGLFQKAMQKQFGTQGAFGSGGWAALSPAYEAWKSAHYPGRPIGVLSGALRSGMTGGSGYTEHIGKDEADFGLGGGPAMEYGRYFDAGGRGPARKVIAMPRSEFVAWRKEMDAWVVSVLGLAASAFGPGAGPSLPKGVTGNYASPMLRH